MRIDGLRPCPTLTLVEQVLAGRQPKALTLGALTAGALPVDWDQQRMALAGR